MQRPCANVSEIAIPDSIAVTGAPAEFSPEKRAAILRGAACVFTDEGYEGASMARIAQEAGVSKGTLYNYFESKADLFAAHVESQCSHNLARIFDGVGEDGDPADALRETGRRMLRMMLSPAGLATYRVVISEAAKFPTLARAFYDAGPARGIAKLADWLAEQTRRGRLRVDDPVFAAEQFFALSQTRLSLLRRLHMHGEPTEAEIGRVVEGAVSMFLARYGR